MSPGVITAGKDERPKGRVKWRKAKQRTEERRDGRAGKWREEERKREERKGKDRGGEGARKAAEEKKEVNNHKTERNMKDIRMK